MLKAISLTLWFRLSYIERMWVNLAKDSKVGGSTSTRGSVSASRSTKTYGSTVNNNMTQYLERSTDGSMRLFGLPHQFLEMNDPRIGDKSNLGRCFAERLVMEAPVICLKPGLPDFLPGKSDEEKAGFISRIQSAASSSSDLKSLFSGLTSGDDGDTLLYYSIKDQYNEMMAKVNIMCKMMAVFLGISDTKVPWVSGNAKFGNYDWRYYSFKNLYNDVTLSSNKSGSVGAFVKNAINTASTSLMTDTQWLRFYVDGNTSFGESVSNSTSSSILESFTEKLEGVSKELSTIAGIAGSNALGDLAEKATSSLDSYIQEHVSSDGPMATVLKRITGASKDILSGGNFLIPEVWQDSEYAKSYSFTITLSTPYGCKESWYLNIGVPLMHILGLCLPQQLTANTYKSPYLVKCYSKGWFNCNYGIIDSVSIEKGSDSSWSVGGLPNEVKVSLSVKDLYSTLSIPVEPYEDMTTFLNTGMLEFLMVNCGVDITSQDMDDRLKIWTTILGNNFTDRFTSKPYEVQNWFKSKVQGMFSIIK